MNNALGDLLLHADRVVAVPGIILLSRFHADEVRNSIAHFASSRLKKEARRNGLQLGVAY